MQKLYEIYSGEELKIAELILRRRLQLLVNSYLYYEMDTNIIEDKKWDSWARELVQLQADYPEISNTVDYFDEFKDWDASTGAFLHFNDWVKQKAMRLQTMHTEKVMEVKQKKREPVKETPKKKSKNINQISLF